MRIKKFLAMLGCTAVLVSSCVYFSFTSQAKYGYLSGNISSSPLPGYDSDHAYATTKTKKIDIGEGVVKQLKGYNFQDDDCKPSTSSICQSCGGWVNTIFQHGLEFSNSSDYNTHANAICGTTAGLHKDYHYITQNYVCTDITSGGSYDAAGTAVTTTVHLKSTQYLSLEAQYLQNGQIDDLDDSDD